MQLDHSDMTTAPSKIGLGGGCHWCTEGVFASLIGVTKVAQGWIAPDGKQSNFSEAVVLISTRLRFH
jgi:peptide-methionine (S)-S-oxide reductase